MKRLIITGTFTMIKNGGINYSVNLYGQTENHPLCVCFAHTDINCRNYDHLNDVCRELFTKYFEVSADSIISTAELSESKRDIKL